jgi:hypothetical protein
LALDIETRPALVYTWGLFELRVGVDQVVDPGGMMSFAAKWIGKRGVEFKSDFHDGHAEMVQRAWEMLDEADVVLHFNGRSFDVPHLQREFVEAGMPPPSPFKQIDLLLVVRKQFRFLSNKLAHVAPQLGLEGKVEHEGFPLWTKCINGDAAAWKRMRRYNIRDVTLLEDAYEILQPWVPSHPSHAAFTGKEVCPKCGGTKLQWRGYAVTSVSRYRRFQCGACGAWGRSVHRETHAEVAQVAA